MHRVTQTPPLSRATGRLLGYTYNPMARRIHRVFAAHPPDVIHLHNLHSTILLSPLVHALRAPTVAHLHDHWPVCNRGMLYDPVAKEACTAESARCCFDPPLRLWGGVNLRIKRRLVAQLAAKVRIFISPSEFLVRTLRERGFPGADKVRVLPHGVEVPQAPPPGGSARPPSFLYVGRMVDYKNPSLGLRLLKRAKDEDVDARLDLVGDGPSLDSLKAQATAWGLDDRVAVHGRLPHAETLNRIGRARALLLPSLCAENSPFAVYESLALGTPPLVSRSGGAEELLSDGEQGHVLDPLDEDAWWGPLRALLTEDSLQAEMGAAAHRHAVARYGMEDHLQRIERLYDEVV